MTDKTQQEIFEAECKGEVQAQGQDLGLKELAQEFYNKSAEYKYTYHYSWMGRPIIQLPQDMLAMQEIIWETKPDLIVECGIAHGGSIIYYASLLELQGFGEVLGIDRDIRLHNREAIESHPMSKRITMIEGSSVELNIANKVREMALGKRVIVVLDSNHTHQHVLDELRLYAPLVSPNSYCVVMDTVVEDMPSDAFPDRPWGAGDNPRTAVHAYLREDDRFVIDEQIHNKLLITVARDGYLKRVR